MDSEEMQVYKAVRERLAALAHEQWSGWMEYLFSKCDFGGGGKWIIPVEYGDRWQRQMRTPYAELTEAEKESDRKEADRVLSIIEVPLVDRLIVEKDGNAYCIHLYDFVDLQESMAIFFDENSWQGQIIREWWEATPLIHLPLIELMRIYEHLIKENVTTQAVVE
jgi:hypothetical protein